ncbi:hypothetical protein ACJ2A9_10405 [Anaerobacillus sp. MEB173]
MNETYSIEDLKNYEEVMRDITALEQKIEKETGKHVALIAYTDKAQQ